MTPRTASGFPADGVAADLGIARRTAQQRGEHLERRRLARAVRADEAEDLALLDLELDAGDGQAARRSAWSAARLRTRDVVIRADAPSMRAIDWSWKYVCSSPNWSGSTVDEAEQHARRSRRRSAAASAIR